MAAAKKPRRDPAQADGLQEFKKALSELKSKSQTKITDITKLAEERHFAAAKICHLMAEEMLTAEPKRMQPIISVLDSILKKVGKEYKTQLSERMPGMIQSACLKSDDAGQSWIKKMVTESWRRHDLLPVIVLDMIDSVVANPRAPLPQAAAAAPPAAAVPPVPMQPNLMPGIPGQLAAPPLGVPAWPPQQQAFAQPQMMPPQMPLVPGMPQVPVPQMPMMPAAPTVAQVPMQQFLQPQAPATPVVQLQQPPTPAAAQPATPAAAALAPAAKAAGAPEKKPSATKDTPEVVERRLAILTKIIEKKTPEVEELQDIMKVPEIRKAIKMQHTGKRSEAMALLSSFKQDLEKKHANFKVDQDPRRKAEEAQAQPKADAKRADPRRPDSAKVADPRQAEKPVDPRAAAKAASAAQAAGAAATASDAGGAGKRGAEVQPGEAARQKQQRVAAAGDVPGQAAASGGAEAGSDDEALGRDSLLNGQVVPARQILQGLPSIGFSEAWLRQFMEQMPTKAAAQAPKMEAPCVGRKVLGALGDQMVYVDELSPNEVILLMQLIFLLEERLRRSSGGVDLAQRIPHTFSYLQSCAEPAIDVMLKRFFDEVPFQCTTTGLRFATRDKLRKHMDVLYRRRQIASQKQRGADARGWMESIPEWVGNRDLVVGPALFRLGGTNAEEQAKAQELQRSAADADAEPEEEDSDTERNRWVCPFDSRRSVCPVSGEPFERIWSTDLNDWAFANVAAVELSSSSSKPLRFPRKAGGGAPDSSDGTVERRLSETAVLFKKSCFVLTKPEKRQQALEECRSIHCLAKADANASDSSARKASPPPREEDELARQDADLAMLMRQRPPPRKCF